MRRRALYAAAAILVPIFLFWLLCMHFTPVGKGSIQRNHLDGSILLDDPGIHITPPWVQAAQIELRPMQVCITTAGKGYNCKLVQFNPDEYEQFVDVEGFRYYWLANRISLNLGHDKTYRGFEDIMRGHAFGAESYDFLTVLQGYVE